MTNWKIIPLIESLLKHQEAEKFAHWLQERSRDQDSFIFKLFQAMLALAKEGRLQETPGEIIWGQIRPEDSYQDPLMRQYRSELKQKIERFWLEKALDRNDETIRLLKYQEFKTRGLDGLLEKAYRLETDKWKDKDMLGLQNLWFRFQLAVMRNQLSVKRQDAPASSLPEIIETFLQYSLANLMSMACIRHSQNGELVDSKDQEEFSYIITKLLQREPSPEQGILYVYVHLYRFLKGEDDGLIKVCNALGADNHSLNKSELWDIFSLLNNGISRRMNEGKFADWQTAKIDLYEWGMQVGISFSEEYLNPIYYRNYAITCIRAEQYERAYEVIHKWGAFLPKEAKESFQFCLGYYYYSKGEYESMIPHWYPKIQFQNQSLQIFSRLINLQKNYEQYWNKNEQELYESRNRIRPLERYIQRQKDIPDSKKHIHLLRLSFLKRLFRKMNSEQLADFQQEVLEVPGLDNRKWFLNQIRKRLEQDG